jgi:hypothetical protein
MRRTEPVAVLIVLLAIATAGCWRGQATIPPGGRLVHVVVTGANVRLDPATVPPGDVYVVLDTPGSSVGFASRQDSAEATPGPMADDDLARLALGDTQWTAISGFDNVGCSADQRAEDWGLMGYCGNVFKERLTPGKYAFFIGDPDGEGPLSIAVLEVVP